MGNLITVFVLGFFYVLLDGMDGFTLSHSFKDDPEFLLGLIGFALVFSLVNWNAQSAPRKGKAGFDAADAAMGGKILEKM
ncbi:hypothetical protein FG314_24820 [Vibrio alginolyticus]|nr:hypothetical protein [Vibrio alginolyticus]EHA1123324.1 hypothetical protein [Vibrio alginolyticus]